MSAVTRHMSAEELIKLPRDRARYELLRGELQTKSPSGSKRGAVSARLAILIGQFVEANQLGVIFGSESGYLVERNPDTVLAPDLSFIRNERIPEPHLPDAYWAGAPDLVAEVASPNDSKAKISEKTEKWLAAGARVVWNVDPPTRTVEICMKGAPRRISSDDEILTCDELLPGFQVQVSELFVRRRAR